MSTRVRQALQGAAGAAGGGGLNVEDVFSNYLYTGNASTQAINNGIDLSGEGGLLWIKKRSGTASNFLFGSDRSADNTALLSNTTLGYYGTSYSVSHSSTGFTVPATTSGDVNESGHDYASWTFRKAPKFFDVVTYTGTGSARTVSHNLGSVPGMIIIKGTDTSYNWYVYHRENGTNPNQNALYLNATSVGTTGNNGIWNSTTPTSTVFTVGNSDGTNELNKTYVAYLFAHNDGDADFGSTADQDIIKCGSFNTPSSGDLDVSLGFEPQFILFKRSDASENWGMRDVMRGMSYGPNGDARLWPNLNSQEFDGDAFNPTPTGFTVQGGTDLSYSANYIYIAIRRGPMAVPESATDVFTPLLGLTSSSAPPIYQASHTIDMVIEQPRFGDSAVIIDRLRGNRLLKTAATNAEAGNASYTMDYQTGAFNRYSGQSTWYVGQCFRRAPSFCDVVAYTGNGVSGRTVSHNLGVAPEMMWVKARNFSSGHWIVYHKGANGGTNPEQYYALLNDTSGFFDGTTQAWNDTAPTSSVFTLGTGSSVNSSSYNYIAYLFASLDGVSKVGSYTGNGTSQTIDCGFSSGARFVLIKRVTSAGANWYVFDTARGIVAGNDPVLYLNQTQAEWSGDDYIDPDNSGFQVTGDANGVNDNGDTFIFYAIA